MNIADKQKIIQLLQSDTAYQLTNLIEKKISETMLKRYQNGLDPTYKGKETNKVDIGKISLDNGILLTDVSIKLFGGSMKTEEKIQEEIQQLETILEVTDGKEKVIELKARIDALEWVLAGSEPIHIY
ncbi:hypothetical protein [Enterococcus sp. AZ101]|uniref:hypothetical protein n=1 Tax=Enterococcus sp. AZ101 TaxID=2774742 RepID=UPI003D26C937